MNMRIPNRIKRGFAVAVFAAAAGIMATSLSSSRSRAAELESTLDEELDALSTTAPISSDEEAVAAVSSTPSPNGKKAPRKEEPLSEGQLKESALQDDEDLAPPPLDIAPLEEPESHPQKKAAKAANPIVKKPEPVVSAIAEQTPESIAPGSDEPNSALEARLAKIYSEHSEPVTDEKWNELLGVKAAESYSVQSGDTLWDLSKTLFADGFYWSKLWAENPEIQNPHRIEKGQAIRFIAGTEAVPPEVLVVKEEPDQLTIQSSLAFEKEDVVPPIKEVVESELPSMDIQLPRQFPKSEPKGVLNEAPVYQDDIEGKITQADIDSGVVIEQSEIVPKPPLPPPSRMSRPVLRKIPKSFAETKTKFIDRTVEIVRRRGAAERIPGAVLPGYIAYGSMPEALGTIDEVDAGDMVASLGQSVYIRAKESLKLGSKLQSLTERYDVRSSFSGKIGVAAEVGGVLEVREVVDAQENLYRAQVVYLVNPVRVGSIVIAGSLPRIPVTTTGRRNGAELQIAGGSFSDTRRFFGDGAIVFLDSSGLDVKVGDVLAVQSRRGERRQTIVPNQKTPIGILKVFSVSEGVASAVVVLALQEIRVGDRTGPEFPERLPDLKFQAPKPIRSASAE